ncbi:hypothetical protein [Geodermatophilus sp. URMC 64]
MRISFVVYGLLYVLAELVVARLEEIGWPRLTALDIASAVAHGILTVAIGVAVLVTLDLLGRRWRRSMLAWQQERVRLAAEAAQEPISVQAWRPEPRAPRALPASPASFAGPDYAARAGDGTLPLYVPSEILDRDGRLL